MWRWKGGGKGEGRGREQLVKEGVVTCCRTPSALTVFSSRSLCTWMC